MPSRRSSAKLRIVSSGNTKKYDSQNHCGWKVHVTMLPSLGALSRIASAARKAKPLSTITSASTT